MNTFVCIARMNFGDLNSVRISTFSASLSVQDNGLTRHFSFLCARVCLFWKARSHNRDINYFTRLIRVDFSVNNSVLLMSKQLVNFFWRTKY